MKTTHKLMAAAVVAATSAHQAMAQAGGGINFGTNKVDNKIKGTNETADSAVQSLISNAMMFLALLAVCYGLYGGYLMLTAGGDEKKVEQGKTILFQVVLGLVVIFLANSIVQFVITKILNNTAG